VRRPGLQGRVAFYEILDLSGELRQFIDGTTQQLEQEACSRGHQSLANDGIRLVLEGRTSLEEIAKITGARFEELPEPSFVTDPPKRLKSPQQLLKDPASPAAEPYEAGASIDPPASSGSG